MSLENFESGQLVHLRKFTVQDRAEWEAGAKKNATFLARDIAIYSEYFLALPPWEQARIRAIAAGKSSYKAVVVGKSAARVWGLPVVHDDPATLCLPSGPPPPRSQWFPGTRYVNWKLSTIDVTDYEGIRVALRSRVIFDVARKGSLADGLVLIDHVLHAELTTVTELLAQLERFSGVPGIKKVRRALELADPLSESPLESQARAQLIEAEILEFETQVWVTASIRVDFLIEGWLVVETDGRGKYLSEDDLWKEKKRTDALLNAGYQILHITNTKLHTQIGQETLFIREVRERLMLGRPIDRRPR